MTSYINIYRVNGFKNKDLCISPNNRIKVLYNTEKRSESKWLVF